ncbi:MAG TPA: YlzJ-like family protein [Bacillota bacterium]|nr:YlzJ-like family protein [Bacillota bacterium]HNY68063.1 YlzJ-like family protein [Bacillota bacterium]HOI37614.1 YlzJ-like family protein [Bacillota bacterium]
MLYTIIPLEEVFAAPAWATSSTGSAAAPPIPVPAVVGGVQVLVSPSYDGRHRVERVISTNPLDYLDPRLTPGAMV